METPIYLYNTAHRKKELFEPINPPEVTLYSCGPTVYWNQHLGNMYSVLFVDTLRRVLEFNGYHVSHITNITDVGHLTDDEDQGEDKMEKGAKREGISPTEIADKYTKQYLTDRNLLNVLDSTKYPKASEHIKEQIELIKKLEEKGYTYVIDDGVYFDTSKFPGYGSMAKLDLDNLKEGARVAVNSQKKNPTDFALWKFSPKDQQRSMEWESPWGIGFPGWHLECSAMAMKYLGETIDIHTGGIEHVPIHHTNEIAQSEAATEKPFVNYWLHNDHLFLQGDKKMSKSEGTTLLLSDLVDKGYSPLDFRFLVLQSNYRTKVTFSFEALDAARAGRERLTNFAKKIYSIRTTEIKKPNDKYLSDIQDEFHKAINDDLNTAKALGILFDLVKEVNSQIANNTLSVDTNDLWNWLIEIDTVLGLNLKQEAEIQIEIPESVQSMLADRQLARDNKNWDESDRLRDEISKLGFEVEDTDTGQIAKPLS